MENEKDMQFSVSSDQEQDQLNSFLVNEGGEGAFLVATSPLPTCFICLESHETVQCPLLVSAMHIKDTEVLPKAFASLPSVLKLQGLLPLTTAGDFYEIVAAEIIGKGTQFGPLQAPTLSTDIEEPEEDSHHIYKVEVAGNMGRSTVNLDITNRYQCNWMSLVRPSEDEKSSNAIAYLLNGQIYFIVTKELGFGYPLVVTLSPGYKNFLKEHKRKNMEWIDPNSDSISAIEADNENILGRMKPSNLLSSKKLRRLGPCLAIDDWKCKFCSKVFSKIPDFATHLIGHYKILGAARTEKRRLLKLDTENNVEQSTKSTDVVGFIPTFPYSCDICERKKTFNRAEYMIRHLKKHALYVPANVNEGINLYVENCLDTIETRIRSSSTEFDEDAKDVFIKDTFNLSPVPTNPIPWSVLSSSTSNTCPLCSRVIAYPSLERHQQICEAVKNFKSGAKLTLECKLCSNFEPITDLDEYQVHVAAHTHPFTCQLCQLRLTCEEDLKVHLCTDFGCGDCSEVYETILDFRRHIKSVHEKAGFYCFECVVPFVTQTHRSTHGPKQYSCQTCGKQFHRQTLLTEHLYVHLPPQFSCDHCSRKLKTRKALEVHLRIHSGLKKYTCILPGCSKSFCQKANLEAHRLTHIPKEDKPFVCPYCSKSLASKDSCALHVRAHEQRPFTCSLCSKAFVNAALLRRHGNVAHGLERYACAFCSLVVLQRKHSEYRDHWVQNGYVESRLKAFDSAILSSEIIETESLAFGQSVRTDHDGDGEVIVEGTTNEDMEYHTEEDLILTSEANISNSNQELILLQINQNGEFVLSLGGEEVELVEGGYCKSNTDREEVADTYQNSQ